MIDEQKNNIALLEPKAVWGYFQEICKIPHPSHHEEKLVDYLKVFGKRFQLETVVDSAGNVIIRKPATPGFENRKTVIIQTHLDMVPDKAKDFVHDFLKDPIVTVIDGDWVTANETTLGADNGIGVAATLAILTSAGIQHGPLEALFTICEEDGMDGAKGLEEDVLQGDILLNLDTEADDEFTIGCAGGVNTDLSLPYKKDVVPKGSISYKLIVSGLEGGHSGADIHLDRGNAIKILTRILWSATEKYHLRLADFSAGSPIHNAIPRDGVAWMTVPKKHDLDFKQLVQDITRVILNELKNTDPQLKIELTKATSPRSVLDKKTQSRLLNALYGCPHGVVNMSPTVPGLVQTSTNLGHVHMKNGVITVFTLQRGSVDSLKEEVARSVHCIFSMTGGSVSFTDPYPGWAPNPTSAIIQVMKKSYVDLFGKEPSIKAIHAGLECGIIGGTYPKLDMISLGPTLMYPHSPSEKVNIPSVKKFWKLLLATLENIPKK